MREIAVSTREASSRFSVWEIAREWMGSTNGRIAGVALVLFLLYLAWIAFFSQASAHRQPIADFYLLPVFFAASISAWMTSRHPALEKGARRAWFFCALAFFAYASGNTCWLLFDLAGVHPLISWADLVYLTYYPLLFVGLLSFPTAPRSKGDRLKLALDVGTVMLAGGAVVWYLILSPALNAASPKIVSTLITVAYPIGDLALLFASALVLLHRPSAMSRHALALLGVGGFALFIGDLLYGYVVMRDGRFHAGTMVDAVWQVAAVLWFFAAQYQRWNAGQTHEESAHDEATLLFGVSLLPYAGVAVGFGLLVVVAQPHWTVSIGMSVVMVVMLTTLVLFRQTMAVRENARLIAERMILEAELTHQAFHDPLTGLSNRARLRTQAHRAVSRIDRSASQVAVVFLDLDNFKAVNDSLGHLEGDRLLVEVAARLLNATRGCDTVARLGGDEFAVLIEKISSDQDAIVIAERISQAMARPFALEGGDVVIGASLGIARGRDGQGVDDLLRNADVAMYVTKRGGRGCYTVFEQVMQLEVRERLALEADLRVGIARGELRLVYQPIVELTSGRMTGVEALVRWQHPERGLLSPDVFISIAEDTGLIIPLGRWVLAEAARQGAEWMVMTAEHFALAVSVNISGRQLQEPTFADEVSTVLRASGFPPAKLLLEITENEIMRDTEGTLTRLHALKALGLRLAIDDFGTGYSSLRYLQRFPIDMLKIDKCFVDQVASAGNGEALARMIVALGETLSLVTVAEGVEAGEQAVALRAMGCQHAQGYHFSRPLTALAVSALLGRGRRNAPIFPLVPHVAETVPATGILIDSYNARS